MAKGFDLERTEATAKKVVKYPNAIRNKATAVLLTMMETANIVATLPTSAPTFAAPLWIKLVYCDERTLSWLSMSMETQFFPKIRIAKAPWPKKPIGKNMVKTAPEAGILWVKRRQ